MKAPSLMIVLLVVTTSLRSMGQSDTGMQDFDFLVQKIKADYPGYHDKVTAANQDQLKNLERKLREKIKQYPDSCYYFMNEYTDFFRDHHLRVRPIRNEPSKKTEIMDHSTYGKNMILDEDSLQKTTLEMKGIEGVWEGFRETFEVIHDGQKLAGVVLEKEGWKKGQVAYEFVPLNDSLFEVQYHSLVNGEKTSERTGLPACSWKNTGAA